MVFTKPAPDYYRYEPWETPRYLRRTPYRNSYLEKALTTRQRKVSPDDTLVYRDLLIPGLWASYSPASQIIDRFNAIKKKGGREATDDFYRLCQNPIISG